MQARRILVWTGQLLLAAVVIGFVGRSVISNWGELSALDVTFRLRPLRIVGAAVTVWGTYVLLIEAWRRILLGWNQQLRFRQAVPIWCLSNLGRYLPGKVWSIAGLAVLAQRVGVAGWAAAGSALAMQALAVGTGAIVVAVWVPAAAVRTVEGSSGASLLSPVLLVAAALLAFGAVAALTWKPLSTLITRVTGPKFELRPLPAGTAVLAAAVTFASWIAYGVAFWLLAHGLFEASDLTLRVSIGVFAAGYIVGLLALFAPGGVGMRELVFIALLGPLMRYDVALALAVASRLLLTATELGAALAALAMNRKKEVVGEPSSQ
ncbi:MAG: flippase-like domain-containing protein [Gemmatimonadota bacterium]|nr:MAG: flippase-like domain-containing protein [Gemmatimonadota bacterium]